MALMLHHGRITWWVSQANLPPWIFITILSYWSCWNTILWRLQAQRLNRTSLPLARVPPCPALQLCEVQEAWYHFGKSWWQFQLSGVVSAACYTTTPMLGKPVRSSFLHAFWPQTELSWRFFLMSWTDATTLLHCLVQKPAQGRRCWILVLPTASLKDSSIS